MPHPLSKTLSNLKPQRSRRVVPVLLAFSPAFLLAVHWFAVQGAMVVLSAIIPVIYMVHRVQRWPLLDGDRKPNVLDQPTFEALLEETHETILKKGNQALLLCLVIEDHDTIIHRHGLQAAEKMLERVGGRLTTIVRQDDHVAYLGQARFALCTTKMPCLDLENAIQIATRVQSVLEDPVEIDGLSLYLSATIGFCQHARSPGDTSKDWIEAANHALRSARRAGPGAVRAFSAKMGKQLQTQGKLQQDVTKALQEGQIVPWFQPQISTDTGHVTGFEALARWSHPEHGMISPAEFLPAIEESGQLEHLADVMIAGAFAALKAWDQAEVSVPRVGVNFAGPELNNPRLTDKIKWELDRFDLTPDRLAVEVLETVVSSTQDDMITRNIKALRELGCCVDLDDFGTGQASIASIKRFSVARIKIDRSFVMKADRDPDQQRMISAILTMAEQLQIETLAEGVETAGEHALLAQLGCDHVQGFGIARPMPFEQTLPWIMRHQKKLADVPRIMNGKRG